jgi:hypothetical protein
MVTTISVSFFKVSTHPYLRKISAFCAGFGMLPASSLKVLKHASSKGV